VPIHIFASIYVIGIDDLYRRRTSDYPERCAGQMLACRAARVRTFSVPGHIFVSMYIIGIDSVYVGGVCIFGTNYF